MKSHSERSMPKCKGKFRSTSRGKYQRRLSGSFNWIRAASPRGNDCNLRRRFKRNHGRQRNTRRRVPYRNGARCGMDEFPFTTARPGYIYMILCVRRNKVVRKSSFLRGGGASRGYGRTRVAGEGRGGSSVGCRRSWLLYPRAC